MRNLKYEDLPLKSRGWTQGRTIGCVDPRHPIHTLWHQFLIAAVLLAPLTLARAIELNFGALDPRNPDGAAAVILTGEIRPGDLDVLRSFVRKDLNLFQARTIVLASPGGDLLEAIRIGTFLRKLFSAVFVDPKLGTCASACFMIYVAAIERSAIVPGLGIHRPYFTNAEFDRLPLVEAERRYRQLSLAVRAYLEEQQVPQYLIERMFSLASTEIYWLTYDDLKSLGVRANWWDQILVSRCRLDKELEQDFLEHGKESSRASKAMEHLYDVATCGYEISEEDRRRNLRDQLAAPKPRRRLNAPS